MAAGGKPEKDAAEGRVGLQVVLVGVGRRGLLRDEGPNFAIQERSSRRVIHGKGTARQGLRCPPGQALVWSVLIVCRTGTDGGHAEDMRLLAMAAVDLLLDEPPRLVVEVMPFEGWVLRPRMADVRHRDLDRP